MSIALLLRFLPPASPVPVRSPVGAGPIPIEQALARLPRLVRPFARGALGSALGAKLRLASYFGELSAVEARLLDMDGRPLSNAQLSASVEGFELIGLTDERGRVRLESRSLPSHVSVRLVASAEGGLGWSGELTVGAGKTYALGELYLTPCAQLRGLVVDAKGVGLVNTTIVLTGSHVPPQALEETFWPDSLLAASEDARSNAEGDFFLPHVPLGPVMVWAIRSGYRKSHSDVFQLAAGEVSDGLILRLERLEAPQPSASTGLRVLVLDREGRPAQGASLCVRVAYELRDFVEYPTSEGRCQLGAGGEVCELWARSDSGWSSETLREPFAEGELVLHLRAQARRLSLRLVDTNGRRIERAEVRCIPLEEGQELVDAQPDAHAFSELALEAGTGSGERAASEIAAGEHSMPVPEGRFYLDIEAPGYRHTTTAALGPELGPDPLELRLEGGTSFEGRALDANGAPVVADVSLIACDERGLPIGVHHSRSTIDELGEPSGRTAADGHFCLHSLAPLVPASPARGGWMFVRVRVGEQGWAESAPLALREGRIDVDLRVQPTASIRGRLAVPADRDAAGWWVVASRGMDDDRRQRVGSDALFEFDGLVPGHWAVRVLYKDSLQFEDTSSYGAPSKYAPAALLLDSETAPEKEGLEFELAVDERVECELPLELPRLVHLLGRALLDGAPAAGVMVRAHGDRMAASQVTYSDGRGRFESWIEAQRTLRVELHVELGGSRYRFSESVEIDSATVEFERELQTATLVIEGARRPVAFYFQLRQEGGASADSSVWLGSRQDPFPLRVPAGRGTLEAIHSTRPAPLELELRPGEVRHLRFQELLSRH